MLQNIMKHYNVIEYKIYLNKKTGEVQNVHPR